MSIAPPFSQRLQSIDMLRGLVILIMVIDHVRETFFLHMQVSDPMDIMTVSWDLYISRFIAHLCAPIFVFLTGLSASLYGQKHQSNSKVSQFLLIRGLFLMLLELTAVNFAWTFQFPPHQLFLQVIWAIGLSMIALSVLIWLPRPVLLVISILIIAGHNLLDHIHFPETSFLFIPWAILHDKLWIHMTDIVKIRTTYPVLPWIGVISLGYYCGAWFKSSISLNHRHRLLLKTALMLLFTFFIIRFINIYGDHPWSNGQNLSETLMSFFNITKYPPSFLFLTLTLGIGLLFLALLEKYHSYPTLRYLAVFGSVPLFFYLLHLYVLKFLYLLSEYSFGKNKGAYFGFNEVWQLWIFWFVMVILLYPCVKWFSSYKANNRHISWLTYL